MYYQPAAKQTGRMWDTWLYLHEETYYLYYLGNRSGSWDNISLATSRDGVDWKEYGRVLAKREGVVWMGSGSTWRSPNYEEDGKFFLNFSEWRGSRQTIFFAESADLIHWRPVGDEYEFKQDERWYEPIGRWDCIYAIPRPGGGLFGYWTATPRGGTGGHFGFGQSLDGARWEALPPPKAPTVGKGEVGAVERIRDHYYMMFGARRSMVTLVADRPEGPFHRARKNDRLLSGHTYFSRFLPAPDGMLVNHHSIARNGAVYFAPLKSAAVDDEGTLRLAWWTGNEKLKGKSVEVKLSSRDADNESPVVMLAGAFDVDRGIILEGRLNLPPSNGPGRVGLYIECVQQGGAAVLVGSGGAELGLGQIDGPGFKVEKRVDRGKQFSNLTRFRLLLKHSLMEFYLDDILIECFSLPATATGRIGLITGGERNATHNLKAWCSSE